MFLVQNKEIPTNYYRRSSEMFYLTRSVVNDNVLKRKEERKKTTKEGERKNKGRKRRGVQKKWKKGREGRGL